MDSTGAGAAVSIQVGTGKRRKRGRPPNPGKEEGKVCFLCYDGGTLILCDKRQCYKAYHPECLGRTLAFFRTRGAWLCARHFCSKCSRPPASYCVMCPRSFCQPCFERFSDGIEFSSFTNGKGLCGECLPIVKMIENNENVDELGNSVDFNDSGTAEFLFKEYWQFMKSRVAVELPSTFGAVQTTSACEATTGKRKRARLVKLRDGPRAADCAIEDDEGLAANEPLLGSVISEGSPMLQGPTAGRRRAPTKVVRAAMTKADSDDPYGTSSSDEDGNVENAGVNRSLDNMKEYQRRRTLKSCLENERRLKPKEKRVLARFDEVQNESPKKAASRELEGHIEEFKRSGRQVSQQQCSEDQNAEPSKAERHHLRAHRLFASPKKRRSDRKLVSVQKPNITELAAINAENIGLIYLRRSRLRELLEDPNFTVKVVGAYVRIRKHEVSYRLVQIIGTSIMDEYYTIGDKMCNIVLQVMNLNKMQHITIDLVSDQNFTEEECCRLQQSIKLGLAKAPTVAELEDKAAALQEAKANEWFDAETVRLVNLRDRASEKGRKKELKKYLKDLENLRNPVYRAKEIHSRIQVIVDNDQDSGISVEDATLDEKLENDSNEIVVPSDNDPIEWFYKDLSARIHGPFSLEKLRNWSKTGVFPPDLRVWKTAQGQESSLLLTDCLNALRKGMELNVAERTDTVGSQNGATLQSLSYVRTECARLEENAQSGVAEYDSQKKRLDSLWDSQFQTESGTVAESAVDAWGNAINSFAKQGPCLKKPSEEICSIQKGNKIEPCDLILSPESRFTGVGVVTQHTHSKNAGKPEVDISDYQCPSGWSPPNDKDVNMHGWNSPDARQDNSPLQIPVEKNSEASPRSGGWSHPEGQKDDVGDCSTLSKDYRCDILSSQKVEAAPTEPTNWQENGRDSRGSVPTEERNNHTSQYERDWSLNAVIKETQQRGWGEAEDNRSSKEFTGSAMKWQGNPNQDEYGGRRGSNVWRGRGRGRGRGLQDSFITQKFKDDESNDWSSNSWGSNEHCKQSFGGRGWYRNSYPEKDHTSLGPPNQGSQWRESNDGWKQSSIGREWDQIDLTEQWDRSKTSDRNGSNEGWQHGSGGREWDRSKSSEDSRSMWDSPAGKGWTVGGRHNSGGREWERTKLSDKDHRPQDSLYQGSGGWEYPVAQRADVSWISSDRKESTEVWKHSSGGRSWDISKSLEDGQSLWGSSERKESSEGWRYSSGGRGWGQSKPLEDGSNRGIGSEYPVAERADVAWTSSGRNESNDGRGWDRSKSLEDGHSLLDFSDRKESNEGRGHSSGGRGWDRSKSSEAGWDSANRDSGTSRGFPAAGRVTETMQTHSAQLRKDIDEDWRNRSGGRGWGRSKSSEKGQSTQACWESSAAGSAEPTWTSSGKWGGDQTGDTQDLTSSAAQTAEETGWTPPNSPLASVKESGWSYPSSSVPGLQLSDPAPSVMAPPSPVFSTKSGPSSPDLPPPPPLPEDTRFLLHINDLLAEMERESNSPPHAPS